MALEQQVGVCAAAQMASALGVKGGDGRAVVTVPSFTLGTPLATPLAMANWTVPIRIEVYLLSVTLTLDTHRVTGRTMMSVLSSVTVPSGSMR